MNRKLVCKPLKYGYHHFAFFPIKDDRDTCNHVKPLEQQSQCSPTRMVPCTQETLIYNYKTKEGKREGGKEESSKEKSQYKAL